MARIGYTAKAAVLLVRIVIAGGNVGSLLVPVARAEYRLHWLRDRLMEVQP